MLEGREVHYRRVIMYEIHGNGREIVTSIPSDNVRGCYDCNVIYLKVYWKCMLKQELWR